MKPDEYTFWKNLFADFKISRMLTHREGVLILVLLTISAGFILSQIPVMLVLGAVGFVSVVIIFALAKIEVKLYEIRQEISQIRKEV